MKRKWWIILALAVLAAALWCGTALADEDRAFTTQPEGGSVFPDNSITLRWATNFTPVRIAIRYYDKGLNDIAELSGTATSYPLKYADAVTSSSYYVYAYYGDNPGEYVVSKAFTVTVVKRAFTASPEGGNVEPDGSYRLYWSTNFIPVKIQVGYYIRSSSKFCSVKEFTSNTSSYNLPYDSVVGNTSYDWYIRAYYGSGIYDYVSSSDFEMTVTRRCFTVQPEDGHLEPEGTVRISWDTNFAPTKIEIGYYYNFYNSSFNTIKVLDSSRKYYDVPYDDVEKYYNYYVHAYYGDHYVSSDPFTFTKTSRCFELQPSDGTIPVKGTKTVQWDTNFTIRKIEVYALNADYDRVLYDSVSGNTKSYTFRYADTPPLGYEIKAYYNDDYGITSRVFHMTPASLGFSTQPESQVIIMPQQSTRIHWALDFTPVKLELWTNDAGEGSYKKKVAALASGVTSYPLSYGDEREYWLQAYYGSGSGDFYCSTPVRACPGDYEAELTCDEHIYLEPDTSQTITFTANFTPKRIEVWTENLQATNTTLVETLSGTVRSYEITYAFDDVVYFNLYYDDINGEEQSEGFVIFNHRSPREFTVQPVQAEDPTVPLNEEATISWETNFAPTKIEIARFYWDSGLVYEVVKTLSGSSTSCEVPIGESYVVRAYYQDKTGSDFLKSQSVNVEAMPATVTFDANGGACSVASAQTGTDGKLASLPAPVRDNYNFAYWYTLNNGHASVVKTDTVFTENTTVYACWSAVYHSIRVTDGTASPTATCLGNTVTITASGKTGTVFSHWEVLSGNVTLADPDSATTTFVMGTEDVTIQACYDYIPVRITFDAGGGTVSPFSAMTGTDGKLASLPLPTRENYIFHFWYRLVDGSVQIAYKDTVYTKDTTLYASWGAVYHSVTVNSGTADPGAAPMGTTVAITAEERENLTFTAWEVLSGGVTVADPASPETTFVMGTEDVTIRATYTYTGTTLTDLYVYVDEPAPGDHPSAPYSSSGEYRIGSYQWTDVETVTQLSEEDTFLAGKAYELSVIVQPNNFPFDQNTLNGYVNDSGDGVTCEYMTFSLAKVRKTFTTAFEISFDAGGGTGSMENAFATGTSYTLPDCGFTAPVDCTFAGWDCGQPGDTVEVTENRVITAQWQMSPGTIPIDEEHFPDANFRTYVGRYDKNASGCLSETERSGMEVFSCNGLDIASFAGIEYFPNLYRLYANNNPNLTELSISGFQKLYLLQAYNCSLTRIDVNDCPVLGAVMLNENPLTEVNLGNCSRLNQLNVVNCPDLHTVDISNQPNILYLNIYGSGIMSLNILSNPYMLEAWNSSFSVTEEYEHYYSGSDCYMKINKGTELIVPGSVPVDAEHFPDAAFRAYVENCFDTNGSGWLSPAEIDDAFEVVMESENGLASLEGIEYLTNLHGLVIGNKAKLTSVSLSANTKLENIDFYNAGLTSLDVSGLNLESLNVSRCPLGSLILGEQPDLWYLSIYGPDVTIQSLDIRSYPYLLDAVLNGTMSVPDWGDLYEGPLGGVLFVNANMELIVPGSIPVDAEHFPDNNFRYYIAEYPDSNRSGWLTPTELSAVSVITLEDQYVATMQGIEYFTELTEITCDGNPDLTSLDLRANTRLTHVIVFSNALTELNLDGLTSVKVLCCDDNALTGLDVSPYRLTWLECENNPLSRLTLGSQPDLTALYCYGTGLTELDITGCPHLIEAYHGTMDTSEEEYDRYFSGRYELLVDKGQKINAGDPEPTFFLPANLTAIEDEAFSGISAEAVVIPGTVTSIAGNPFAGSSVTTIYGVPGSAAQAFAEAYGYAFVPVRND